MSYKFSPLPLPGDLTLRKKGQSNHQSFKSCGRQKTSVTETLHRQDIPVKTGLGVDRTVTAGGTPRDRKDLLRALLHHSMGA
jgi:hypothetical protein